MTKEEESQIIGKTVRDLFEKGVKRIVVSMGKEGALMRERGFAAAAEAIPVEVQSTVGAGDAFAAALAYAWENKLDKKEAFQLGMAVSAGAVTTEGTRPPSLKKVQELVLQCLQNYLRHVLWYLVLRVHQESEKFLDNLPDNQNLQH